VLAAVLAACSLDTRDVEDPVAYTLAGLFDSARYTVTVVGQNDNLHVSDSLRGQLTLFNLHTNPQGDFAIWKCGATCYGLGHAASLLQGGGVRNGDSVAVMVVFNTYAHITFVGVDYGDSVAGKMTSVSSQGSNPISYLGRFVALRNP
jgi:hypothetical protein